MTIDELVEHYYDDLDGAITGFSGDTDTLDITFEYNESFQGETPVATIRCTDVRECTLRPVGVAELTRPADHPLLWQHVEPHRILAFSSAPSNPFELLGRLYSAHEELFGRWRAPRDYIHATPETLSGGHGQLAHGPEKAIHVYREIAHAFVQCSVVPQFTPKDSVSLFCLMKRLSSVAMSLCSIHPKRPNQALERTATRFAFTFCVARAFSL